MTTSHPRHASHAKRRRLRVAGVVQGVGFRPFVHAVASRHGLAGFVLNDGEGVVVEAEGEPGALDAFAAALARDAPPLARVESITQEAVAPRGERRFSIAPSHEGGSAALVAPDVATCEACLRELFDPADRRHRYPFVNCTQCGPRFTIVLRSPYDRANTTMAGFRMCSDCLREYEDPADRRHHAEPIACPACGPSLRLLDAAGEECTAGDPIRAAATALRAGSIVAVKGLGGFHLACDATSESAVARLRARKRREERPFALMVSSLDEARALVELAFDEERLLAGRERPIVIARRRPGAAVAAGVAPGAPDLGVMLPYSPLHHLLLGDAGTALVMTSGNLSDEPIAYEDDDALRRLATIADLFLVHDRPIHMRTDDSVLRARAGGTPQVVRRSRGHVPASVDLPVPARRPLLACGAELKSSFCLAAGRRAWPGHHVGDLRNWETLSSFREGIAHFERLFGVEPEVVAHDLHPDYLSTGYALEREGVELVRVQHHHAHLAACLAEHGETGPAVGAIFDGTGYGEDGTVWGGELLAGDLTGYERAGHLYPVCLPGGDRAVSEPWRMACAWLVEAFGGDPVPPRSLAVDSVRWRQVAALARGGRASPVTTSAGRLFDAVAALCGIRSEVSYEGQAAAELEAAADPRERSAYPLTVTDGLVLDPRETVHAILDDLRQGTPVDTIAARFHNALATATAHACAVAAEARGLATVVLSGGVFQNRLLLERTEGLLHSAGLRVLTPELLPPNDGGIAYGQAAVAAARGRSEVQQCA